MLACGGSESDGRAAAMDFVAAFAVLRARSEFSL